MIKIIKYKCKYCDKIFDTQNGVLQHKVKKHNAEFMDEPAYIEDSKDYLDISRKELKEKRQLHTNVCDICGKIETANTRPDTKETPNQLCVDHDHKTKKFRGFLCVQCNRNFGWYDTYKDEIHDHENFKHI